MRLWSLHPGHLDPRGLVALWREGLLAQAVLRGATSGYRHHPQLLRFREQGSPVGWMAAYLREVHRESVRRGFRFDAARISGHAVPPDPAARIDVPLGQIEFEWRHLLAKLADRAPRWRPASGSAPPRLHPLFRPVPGGVAPWERGATARDGPPRVGSRPDAGPPDGRASRG